MENHGVGIKFRGFGLSYFSVLYIFIPSLVVCWVYSLILSVLSRISPDLNISIWLLLPSLLLLGVPLLFPVLTSLYTVTIDPDKIVLKWCGFFKKAISTADLKLFCSLGNEKETFLCLSFRSEEELAQAREHRLLRSSLNKHNVPLLKQRPNWQHTFARDRLLRIHRDPLRLIKRTDIVVLTMSSSLQYRIQHMYPQLPYRNFTGTSYVYTPKYNTMSKTQAVRFPAFFYNYQASLQAEGIHVSNNSKTLFSLPAEKIKTAIRVDIFTNDRKNQPAHCPLLFVSCLSEEDLLVLAPQQLESDFPDKKALLALMCATDIAKRWTPKDSHSCLLYYTEKNLQTFHSLYPNIPINGIGANWLYDAN